MTAAVGAERDFRTRPTDRQAAPSSLLLSHKSSHGCVGSVTKMTPHLWARLVNGLVGQTSYLHEQEPTDHASINNLDGSVRCEYRDDDPIGQKADHPGTGGAARPGAQRALPGGRTESDPHHLSRPRQGEAP